MFLDKPEWPPEQRGEFFGFVSGVAYLTCEAEAEPPAEFMWLDKYNNMVQSNMVINEHRRSTLLVRYSFGLISYKHF